MEFYYNVLSRIVRVVSTVISAKALVSIRTSADSYERLGRSGEGLAVI